MSLEEANALFDDELDRFNEYFVERQRRGGVVDPTPLISAERGAVKAYLIYASGITPEEK